MNDYKLPMCWLGKVQMHDGKEHVVTADEVNLDCTCLTPIAAFMCMEGHMTECHKGMNCQEAECSHLPQYEDEGFFDEGDLP